MRSHSGSACSGRWRRVTSRRRRPRGGGLECRRRPHRHAGLIMHSRTVSEQWQDLESCARSPTWRLVDALITTRALLAKAVPARLRRVVPLLPGLLLAASLVAGLAALLWRSLHEYDSFLAVQGSLSLT